MCRLMPEQCQLHLHWPGCWVVAASCTGLLSAFSCLQASSHVQPPVQAEPDWHHRETAGASSQLQQGVVYLMGMSRLSSLRRRQMPSS